MDRRSHRRADLLLPAVIAAFLASLLVSPPAPGSERKFTYVYETTTQAPGTLEYEQWVTWKTNKGTDSSFDRVDFRHEIEIGLTDRLQLGIYVADWRYQSGRSVEDDGAEFRNSAVELIYNLTDPTLDPFGSALYGEFKFGSELLELEGKLLLEKNLGSWTIAYNATIEAEWEGERYDEDKGKFEQSAGVSFQVSPRLTLGAELVHEVEFPDWGSADDHVLYLGPNASFRTNTWWVTVTPLFQVTSVDSEVDYQLRLLFGFDF
jgi:hypothetical protein